MSSHRLSIVEFTENGYFNFQNSFYDAILDENVKYITVYINSAGGDVYTALSYVDLIQSALKPVITIATGKCFSAGFLVFSAGTPGLRFATKNSTLMFHEVSCCIENKITELTNNTKETNRLNDLMFNLIDKFWKKEKNHTKKLYQSNSNSDYYMSAQKAHKMGYSDIILNTTIPDLYEIKRKTDKNLKELGENNTE